MPVENVESGGVERLGEECEIVRLGDVVIGGDEEPKSGVDSVVFGSALLIEKAIG